MQARRRDTGQSTLEWAAAFAAAVLLVMAVVVGWQGARLEATARNTYCTLAAPASPGCGSAAPEHGR